MSCWSCKPYQTVVLYKVALDGGGNGTFSIDPVKLGQRPSTAVPGLDRTAIFGRAFRVVGLQAEGGNQEINCLGFADDTVWWSMYLPQTGEKVPLDLPFLNNQTPYDCTIVGQQNMELIVNVHVLIDPMKGKPCTCGCTTHTCKE